MKTVPLVVYKDGVRTVIGSANVVDDGNDFVVTANVDASHASLLIDPTPAFSIGEAPESVTAQHKAVYGSPVATALSMGAWARMVESYSDLGKAES